MICASNNSDVTCRVYRDQHELLVQQTPEEYRLDQQRPGPPKFCSLAKQGWHLDEGKKDPLIAKFTNQADHRKDSRLTIPAAIVECSSTFEELVKFAEIFAVIFTYNRSFLKISATYNVSSELFTYLNPLTPETFCKRCVFWTFW